MYDIQILVNFHTCFWLLLPDLGGTRGDNDLPPWKWGLYILIISFIIYINYTFKNLTIYNYRSGCLLINYFSCVQGQDFTQESPT